MRNVHQRVSWIKHNAQATTYITWISIIFLLPSFGSYTCTHTRKVSMVREPWHTTWWLVSAIWITTFIFDCLSQQESIRKHTQAKYRLKLKLCIYAYIGMIGYNIWTQTNRYIYTQIESVYPQCRFYIYSAVRQIILIFVLFCLLNWLWFCVWKMSVCLPCMLASFVSSQIERFIVRWIYGNG